MPSAGISSHPRYRVYLTTHRGILYFRILVPNHLQSLIGKREIRRSLNGLDSRSARTKRCGSRLLPNIFFAWLMILPMNGYIPCRKKLFNYLVSQKKNIKSVGTFLFDSTLEKDLSPASLTLLLPTFFEGAGRNCLL